MSTLLKEGTVVSTKLSSCNIWVQNILYKIKKRSVTVGLLSDYLENIILLGQPFTIKYTTDNSEYIFEGEITKINPDFPSSIIINIVNITQLKNQRMFPRTDVFLAANIKPEKTNRQCFSIIHNISRVGMAFYSKDILEANGEQLECFLSLPNKQTLSTKGEIVRTSFKNDNIIDYGLKFTEIHKENHNILSNFFNNMQEEKVRLRNKYNSSIKRHLI